MQNNSTVDSVLNTIGIAKKAGFVEYGFDSVKKSCYDGLLKAIFISDDISEASKKSISKIAAACSLPCLSIPFSKLEIGKVLSRKPTAIIALKDDGLASLIIKKLNI